MSNTDYDKILLINESPYLLKTISKQVKFENNIKTISTKGFLNTYVKEISYPKDEKLIDYLKKFDNENTLICIATDLDDAGEFIAYEIVKLYTQAKIIRLNIPFEKLVLIDKHITLDRLVSFSTLTLNFRKIQNFISSQKKVFQKQRITALQKLMELDKETNKDIKIDIKIQIN